MVFQGGQALLVDHGLQKEDADGGVACGSSIYRRDVADEPPKLRVPELHLSILPLRTSHPKRLPRPQNNNKLSTLPCPHSCPQSSFGCASRRRTRSEDKVRVPQDAQRADFVRSPAGSLVRAAPANSDGLKTAFLLVKSS